MARGSRECWRGLGEGDRRVERVGDWCGGCGEQSWALSSSWSWGNLRLLEVGDGWSCCGGVLWHGLWCSCGDCSLLKRSCRGRSGRCS